MRARTLQALRAFLLERDYLEVETPVRLAAPALDTHIDAEPSGAAFLRTSPELHMKRLVAEGVSRLFQIGPCFRRGERGRLHQPEYTMLEWYRAGTDYRGVLDDTRALLRAVAAACCTQPAGLGITRARLEAEWAVLSVRDVFRAHAGWNPFDTFDPDRFDMDLVTKVEPALPRDRPVALIDYPEQLAALARCRPERPPVAERWELYLNGVELANAFSELTDPLEQRRRFAACAALRREAGRDVYPMDEAFLVALDAGMPECAGVALGVDRLVMLLAGAASVADVQAFPL
jgi:elongation factor P--(R)-beta-lysine ligase